jgi:hypothetical protein
MRSPDRRSFLKQTAFAMPSLIVGGSWLRGDESIKFSFPGMIVRSS